MARNKLRVAVVSDGFPIWPHHVAQDRGFFSSEGIEIALIVTGSSKDQIKAMEQGNFEIGIQLPDHIVRSVEHGSDLFAFMAATHAIDILLLGSPEVHLLTDLKGRSIAVDGARSGFALLLRRLLHGVGLSESDYELVEYGGTRERLDALSKGSASAAFINPPYDQKLLDRGFIRLTSTLESFPDYPGAVAASRRDWAQGNEELLRRFVRAYRLAFLWLVAPQNKEAALKIACNSLPVSREGATAAWSRLVMQPLPKLTVEGFEEVIDVVWAGDGFCLPKPDPEKFMDLNFQRQIERMVSR